jgi:hypothetical protein
MDLSLSFPIHQPFSFYSFDSGYHSRTIRDFAVIPAESEFVAISEQVMLGQAVKDAVKKGDILLFDALVELPATDRVLSLGTAFHH